MEYKIEFLKQSMWKRTSKNLNSFILVFISWYKIVIIFMISLSSFEAFGAPPDSLFRNDIKEITVTYINLGYMDDSPRGYINDSDLLYYWMGRNKIITITDRHAIEMLLNSLSILNMKLIDTGMHRGDIRMIMDCKMEDGRTTRIEVERLGFTLIINGNIYRNLYFYHWLKRFIPPTNAPLK